MVCCAGGSGGKIVEILIYVRSSDRRGHNTVLLDKLGYFGPEQCHFQTNILNHERNFPNYLLLTIF
eukprot:TRINITY_DN17635_c0_g1_i1.p1 TRINITY_DN17635_c0_g1~~TRINITY_DN17635_c0_g1_i1.p1  ORF type:complete len:66 (+),score=0.62 TRINITY_DN17635_c0_g1_i1:412-609(+)